MDRPKLPEQSESNSCINGTISCIRPGDRLGSRTKPRRQQNQSCCSNCNPNRFPEQIDKHEGDATMGSPEALAKQLVEHHISRAGANMICSAVWIAFEAAIRRLSATTQSPYVSMDGRTLTRP